MVKACEAFTGVTSDMPVVVVVEVVVVGRVKKACTVSSDMWIQSSQSTGHCFQGPEAKKIPHS